MKVGFLHSNNYSYNPAQRVSFKKGEEKFSDNEINTPKEDLFKPDYCSMNITPFWDHLERIDNITDSDSVELTSGYNTY